MKIFPPEQAEFLYKYTESKWVENIIKRGIFRIGTLYEYRSYEQKEIGDPFEGIKQFAFSKARDALSLTFEDFDKKLRMAGDNKKNLENFRRKLKSYSEKELDTVPVAFEVHVPDCYIFCTTKKFDADVMRSFGCDACIEIANPSFFFKELSKAMASHATHATMDSCIYDSRFGMFENRNKCRPQILKDLSLKHQEEMRMIWDPKHPHLQTDIKTSTLKPKIIQRIQAARFCRRII